MKNSKTQQAKEPTFVGTMRAAASVTGFMLSQVKESKRLGCPAFRQGRIYVAELRAWVHERGVIPENPKDDLEIRRLKAQCQRAELELQKELGRHTENSVIRATVLTLADRQKQLLHQKLEVEYPALLKGADEATHRKKGAELVDELCRIFHDGTAQWMRS